MYSETEQALVILSVSICGATHRAKRRGTLSAEVLWGLEGSQKQHTDRGRDADTWKQLNRRIFTQRALGSVPRAASVTGDQGERGGRCLHLCVCLSLSSAHRRSALQSADTPGGQSALHLRVIGLYVDTKPGQHRSMGIV